MKVFFNASLRGKELYKQNYERIREGILDLGHELIKYPLDMSSPEKVAKETEEQSEKYYKDLIGWIGECEVAVFDVSYASLGIGYEVALALSKGKQVIALYVAGKRPFVLESIASDKIQVVEYGLARVKEVLEESFEYAKGGMDTRFTMIMPAGLMHYLDDLNEEVGVTRSDYIRNLINQDMKRRVE